MSSERSFGKYLKSTLFIILPLLVSISCEKDDPLIIEDNPLISKKDTLKDYSPEVSFDITNRLLEGKYITCIEPNYDGNTWIASGNELFYIYGSEQETYKFDHPIYDISIAGDYTLWIASYGGGLGHLTENGVTWFNKENSKLPTDSIRNVEVGLDGRVWFSSCTHDRGGVYVYDGKKFDLFSPHNSILNQHNVWYIEIDHAGSIYVMTLSKVGRTNVYRISDDNWKCLGDENGTFYWAWVFSVGPAGIMYLVEDFGLSSSMPRPNILHQYSNNSWNKLEADFISWDALCTTLKADRRNYGWLACIEDSSWKLHVYNGKSWEESPEGLFLGDKITVIETDMDNNIWVGTANNGVFILEQ
jgi:ligand-binding sensor domain-containing protein